MQALRSSSGLGISLARECVAASAAAYGPCLIESETAHVMVGTTEDGAVLLAFRGTAAPLDYLTDGKIGYAETGLGRVHEGFWQSLASVSDKVDAVARGPVVVCGHSKGGAEALLCAWMLARMGVTIDGVQVFGAPRVGDGEFRDSYNGQTANRADGMRLRDITFCWIHEEDIVPRLPPCVLKGYRRVGQVCFLPALGSGFILNPWIGFMVESDIWGALMEWRRGWNAFLKDHAVDEYARDIKGL